MRATGVPIEYFFAIQSETEDARHRAEVRRIADFDTHSRRTVYLEGVWDERGREAALRLRRDVFELLKAEGRETEPQQEALLA